MEQLVESKAAPLAGPMRAAWRAPGLAHAFFGRLGGFSRGAYASLNLSYLVGDDRKSVERNWGIAMGSMPPGIRIARLNQVHGIAIRRIDSEYSGDRLEGDGLVTATPGIILTILTADCVPLLMVDEEGRIAGALHAGWRGTLAGIATEGVRALVATGATARKIRAALGPSIGQCCFEVDEELADRFAQQLAGADRHCRPGRTGKAFIDLRGVLRDQLVETGVERDSIVDVGPCTRCHSDEFFSRRANGGIVTGLQLSYIGFGAERRR